MKKSNVRHLTTALAAASVLACSPSHALGIGDLQLQSALNQTLQAEIALMLADNEKLSDIRVGFASASQFDNAGIPWSLFLSKIKVQTLMQNGQPIIKLSSTEVLKEPFLDFLLEIKGSKGSLYREFTVLVDPPAPFAPPAGLPNDAKTPTPPYLNNAAARSDEHAPLHFVTPPAHPIALTGRETVYGPVRENETLWHIAAQFNERNHVSINRMLAAIYIANPEAFYSHQSHALIAGKFLKIPLFVNKSASALPSAAHTVKKAKKLPATATIKPIAPTPQNQPIPTQNQKQNQDALAAQQAIEQKMQALEMKLSSLEKTLAEKEAQINASRLTPLPAIVDNSSAPTEQPIAVQPIAVNPITEQSIAESTTPTARSEPMSLPESTPSQTTEPTSPDVDVPPPALLTTRPSPAQTDQIAPEPTVPPTAVPESPKPESNTGYMQIPQELYGYIAGGASALLLGTLAWLRRQRQAPPPAAAADPDHTQDNVVTAHKSSQAETHDLASSTIEEEHEFLSDDSMFTRPNTAVDAQYDDVLYKVDVYCKYGQTTQAMALLQKEFNQQPTAHHYALRLLALYGEQQQKADIIAFVTHLNALGKNTDIAFWQDVTALVSEVCPEALNSSNDNAIANHADSNELTDFSSMAFEDPDNQEIRFGDLDPQQMLVKASADFFESSIQFEDKKATAAFGEFVFAEDDTDAQQPSTDTPHRPLPAETLIAETITADVQPLELAFTTAPDNHDLPAQIDTPLAEDTNVTPSAAPLFNVDASDNSIPFDTFDMGHATVEVLEENNTDKADSTHELTTALTLDETFNAPAYPQPALAPGVDFSVPPTTSMPHEESLSRLDFDFGDFDGDDTALSLEKPQDPTMATPLSFDLDLDFGDFDAQEAHEDAQETQTLAFHAPLAEPDKPQQAPIEQVMIADDQPVSRRHETIPTDAVTHFDSTSFEVSPIDLPVAEAITTQTTQIAPEEGQHNTSAAPLFETTSFPLTKRVEEKTDDPIAYLEMSDAEFAEALAEDVLKKCQIKEQLCRQKIAQEVLNKLR